MSADTVLSRLDGVRRTGEGRWIARCPHHADKRPSLAIREVDDGRVLMHCFAGCGVDAVLSSAGLTFDDLFPARPIQGDFTPSERRLFFAADILRCIGFESLVAAVAASSIAQGEPLCDVDRERLLLAAERLQAAVGVSDHV